MMNKSQSSLWRFVSLLLAVVFVLVSSGCSRSTPSVATPEPDEVEIPESEDVIITFAGYEYQRRFFEPIMESFHEQYPDITVQFVDMSQSFPMDDEEWNQFTYLRNLAQAGDTVLLQGFYNVDMSRYFRDLRPLYEADTAFEPDDFWPGILNACEDTYGNMTGLPLTATVNGIFYDEAAFDASGVPYPKPGWTWDDFQSAVSALADKKGSQVKYGFYDQPDLGISILAPVVSKHLMENGGEVDPDKLLSEVQWYIDLAQADLLSGLKTYEEMENEWEKRARLFEDDDLRPAMWTDTLISFVPTTGPTMYDQDNPFSGTAIDQFGFVPYPISTDGSLTQTSRSWVECAAVSAGSPNPRAAWTWLNYLSQYWMVVDQTQVYEIGRAPSRRSVAESTGYWDLLPAKAVPAVQFALEHGSFDFAYFEQFYDINVALAKTISQNADFAEEIEIAAAARPTQPAPPQDNAPIVVATPRAPLPEGVTAVKYFLSLYGPDEMNAIKPLIEQFNQRSPEVQIQLYTEFYGNPGEDWIGSMASEFDCFTANAPYWEGFDTTKVLNLNSLMSSEPASFSNDFSPEMLDKYRQEGNLYSLPATSQVQMMAYNADLLARRGLSIPDNDWTFDDFIEMASAAASTSDADPSYGLLYSPYDEFISLGKGIQWMDLDSNPPKANFDSPEIREHLQWITNLAEDRVLLDQEADWETANTVMTSGQLAFWTASMGEKDMWFYGMGEEPEFKIGMAPLPQTPTANPMTSWSNDRGHYISAQSQSTQACWDWIKFLSEQPAAFSGVPARLSIANSPAWEAIVGKEDAAAYRAAIANLKPVENIDIDRQQIIWPIYDWRSRAIRAALEGQDLQPVLIAQQQKAETYLACAVSVDTDQTPEKVNEEITACLRQADPEGNW